VTLSAFISIVYIWWSFCISLCFSSSVWHWCFTVIASMHSYEYVVLMHNVMHFFFGTRQNAEWGGSERWQFVDL